VIFSIGDLVEVQTNAIKYKSERGTVTGFSREGGPSGSEVFVKLVGILKPVPFAPHELRPRNSTRRAEEARRGSGARKG